MFDDVKTVTRQPARRGSEPRCKVLVLFGTRPEVIKLAPVIHELQRRDFQPVVVSSSQHTHLLRPFLKSLDVTVDTDLRVMKKDQSPNAVCARILGRLDAILAAHRPDLILVQGDTATTLAGALAGFNQQIPVGHVEAGLRSGNLMSPFPEEMNRRAVSQMAAVHFAATDQNRRNLLAEGVDPSRIFVTGNPVVDSLQGMLARCIPSPKVANLLAETEGRRRILLTTHRRESFGPALYGNLEAIRDFVIKLPDVSLFFPVHPNPNVKELATKLLGGHKNIHLLEPLDYADFLAIMRAAWLIISDSGGVQEEAPSLGKPLLIMRENTERPEGIAAGVSKLIGSRPGALRAALQENYQNDTWIRSVREVANPFGDGRAAARIVSVIEQHLGPPKARYTALRAASVI